MDVAYDHLQESLTDDNTTAPANPQPSSSSDRVPPQPSSLNDELQDAYRAFSNSPWGSRIGGFFGSVVKQGESIYHEAQQELTAVGQDATRGFTDLRTSIINRTRALSLATNTQPGADTTAAGTSSSDGGNTEITPTTTTAARSLSSEDALQESETVLSRLRGEAAKRLKDLQKAEDAADEALLRFGSNLRDFLKDAIKIAPPTDGAGDGTSGGTDSGAVLFESKDAHGKRVIHTSRFDAQLHVIHANQDSFSKDAIGPEYETWYKEFDVDKKTDDIAADLAKYPELRATMEKLVPDQVSYADFWKRYYFLRHGIETAEARRRDLLKAASAEEEVGWDEDSDDETAADKAKATATPDKRPGSTESSTTLHPQSAQTHLKPSEPRKSNDEKSQPDSEASYDVVGARSGVPSQAPNSPKDSRKVDDSDEEDWE